ncbi:MAG: 5-formyltetrahydrofolate cyclo-ligase [Ferruginibacter sp.]
MTKSAIRKLYRQKRLELASSAKERLEDLMLIQFQSLKLEIPDNIMTFAPIKIYNEYNPILIEEYCFFKNPAARLIYPVTNFKENSLQPVVTKEDTLFEVNDYQIDEPVNGVAISPVEIEMMLLPLLGFNEDGYRIGYGKGFYDKLINDCNPTMLKIGFSFFSEVVIDDVNEFDKKMDICITPYRIFQF